MRLLKHLSQLTVIAPLTAVLVGCMMGPNFHSPAAPTAKRYNASPLPKKTTGTPGLGESGKVQTFISAGDIPAEWWKLFHSKEINELIKKGIANSPNLAAAQANMRQAQELLNVQIGNLMFPAVSATLAGERQRSFGSVASSNAGNTFPAPHPFNLFQAAVNVTYTLDVFGANRRELESLQAQVDYQQFQLIGAYLTLTANIVTISINIASLESQISATKNLVTEQESQLTILKKQFKLGGIAITEVLTQQTLVDQTRATLPPLQKSLAQSKHALAVLVGEYSDQPMPNINLDKLSLPKNMPVSLPSNLVRQRPDVRAAEALLHAASAQIGVATANLFPQFNLNAAYGYSSPFASSLFHPAHKIWSWGGQLTEPIFNGGALMAQRRAAIAAYDAAAAQYRQTVLQSFANVADTLRAIELDSRNLRINREAESAARRSLTIVTSQFRLGGANYLDLLTAQQQYEQTRIKRIQAQALRFANSAALFQALGGGWWNRNVIKCGDPINPMHASMSCPE